MATLLFNLRNVPDDEAGEVRALLRQHALPTYETVPSPFGISAGAIWLEDVSRRDEAKRLLADYQRERARIAQAQRDEARAAGTAPTLFGALRSQPLTTLLLILAIVLTIALSAWPFFGFAR